MRESLATEASPAAVGWPRVWAATGGALVALAFAFASWDPLAAPGPVLCLFRLITGIACPGCGLTRAAALLAHGRFAESLALHPGALLISIEIGAGWLLWGERLLFGRLRTRAVWLPILGATAFALLALWVMRWTSGSLPT